MLEYDTYCIITEYLRVRDISALNCVCKKLLHNRQKFCRTRVSDNRLGVRTLYKHQSDMVHKVLGELEQRDIITVRAPMSYGKTSIGLKLAYHISNLGHNVMVIVPKSVYREVWVTEHDKCFGKIRSKDKKFYKYTSGYSDYKIKFTESTNSKIFLVTNRSFNAKLIKIARINYFIYDEAHLCKNNINDNIRMHPKAKHIMLSAEVIDMGYIIDSYSKTQIYNKPEYSIMQEEDSKAKMEELIKSEDRLFVIVLYENTVDAYALYAKFSQEYPDKKIYDFTNRQATAYARFIKTGGYLFSTIRKVKEGISFTKCSHVFITIVDDIKIREYKQCIGRFLRESSVYKKIDITLAITTDMTYIKARLCVIDIPNIEYSNSNRVFKYLEKTPIKLDKLSDYDIITIFATVRTPATVDGAVDISPIPLVTTIDTKTMTELILLSR